MNITAQGLSLDKNLALALQTAIETTLHKGFQVEAEIKGWSIGTSPLPQHPFITCLLEMREGGEPRGAFVMAFSREAIMKLISRYGVPTTSDPQIINDAAEEIVNMIYGMVKTALNRSGSKLAMEIPLTLQGGDALMDKYARTEKMILPFLVDGHQCEAVISQNR